MTFYQNALNWLSRLRGRILTVRLHSEGSGERKIVRDAHLRLAQLMLDEGRIAEALRNFRAVDAIDGRIDVVTEAFTRQYLNFERTQRGEPHYRWLNDVRIDTAYWTLMQNGCVYNDDVHAKNLATSPFVQGRVSANANVVIASLPPVSRHIEHDCILVGGDDNYSHWLFRNILKLSTLDHAGLLYRYPWLINSDLKKYQSEYLDLLGQPFAQLIRVDRNAVIACRHVLVPALHISSAAITQGVQWIRQRFAHLMVEPAQATRRLFVSRRDSERRSIVNEDEIFAALMPLGFERIVPGTMKVVEQIAAFSGARCIVAAHGAALTNMIFAPPGAAIIEITSTAIEHMNLFRKLARSTQHAVTTFVSDDYATADGDVDVNTDFRVDIEAVRAAVVHSLQAQPQLAEGRIV